MYRQATRNGGETETSDEKRDRRLGDELVEEKVPNYVTFNKQFIDMIGFASLFSAPQVSKFKSYGEKCTRNVGRET